MGTKQAQKRAEAVLDFIAQAEMDDLITAKQSKVLQDYYAGAFAHELANIKDGQLPSQFQLDDKVIFSFAGIYLSAEVLNVHFLPGKVKYDLELMAGEDKTRIYNVDSVYILESEPVITIKAD